jgi:uncharacterized protein (TIGR03089 family)
VTFYDDATGERTELSYATTANWVAKTANLLRDGLGAEPSDRVGVLLPLHWQTVVVLLGAWAAGLDTALDDPADVAFAAEERLDEALAGGAREVVGLSLRPMAGRLQAAPVGVLDFAEEVPGHGDHFAEVRAHAGVLLGSSRLTADDLRGESLALTADDRVLTTLSYDTRAGLVAGLVAPLAAGARIVACRNPDPSLLAARARTEGVTASVGLELSPARRLA